MVNVNHLSPAKTVLLLSAGSEAVIDTLVPNSSKANTDPVRNEYRTFVRETVRRPLKAEPGKSNQSAK